MAQIHSSNPDNPYQLRQNTEDLFDLDKDFPKSKKTTKMLSSLPLTQANFTHKGGKTAQKERILMLKKEIQQLKDRDTLEVFKDESKQANLMESLDIVGVDTMAKAFNLSMFLDIDTGHLAMMDYDNNIKIIKKEVFKTKETQNVEEITENEGDMAEEVPDKDFRHDIDMELDQQLEKIEENKKNGVKELNAKPKRKYRPRKPQNKHVLQNEFEKAKIAKTKKLLKLKAMQRSGAQLKKLSVDYRDGDDSMNQTLENSKECDEIQLLESDDEDEGLFN